MTEIVDCIAWVVRKTFWSLGVFLKFLFLRLLDLLGLIFNILACCTIIRLPSMIKAFNDMDKMWEWRVMGFLHILLFILDIPVIIMALFIFATLIRVYPMLRDMNENNVCSDMSSEWERNGFLGFKVRGYILKHFVIVFVDLFCLLFVVVCLLSWRNVIFVRQFKAAESDLDKRGVIFKQFMNVLWDIPLLLCFFVSCCTWRLPFVFMDVLRLQTNDEKWDRIRYVGVSNLCYMLLDLPCIVAFLIAMCTWRSPLLIWQLLPHNIFRMNESVEAQWQIRKICLLQFLFVFCDIPVFGCVLLVVVTVWRIPQLVKHTKKELGKSFSRNNFYKREWKIRAACFKECGMILVDFFSCLLGFVVFLTMWRARPLWKDIQKYRQMYKDDVMAQQKVSEDAASALEAETNASEMGQTMVVKHVKWSHFMWKIRKKMLFHFAMLLVDIPAIPLLILLLITGLRTSKVLSGLLDGQFHLLFAVTVYMETLKLFRDVLFILVFFVLMILRPVASWVHLLEDEDHRAYRIISDILVWIPDICAERGAVYTKIKERLALSIKQLKSRGKTRIELREIFDAHISRLTDLVERLESQQVEGELNSLLNMVIFMERKRVDKMLREYDIETSYMNRCNPTLRNDNVYKYKEEMRTYTEGVKATYDKLLNYKPDKVPLYTNKCGLKLRTGVETRSVIIACLPRGRFITTVLMFVCVLFVYRAPSMIMKLHKKMYNRVNIVLSTLKEYGKDVITLIRIVIVCVFVYRAPVMIADILDCLIEKRSWTAVRKIVKRYPPEMLKDFTHVLKQLLSWETPRFLFTMFMFGILMPAELFLAVVRVAGIESPCWSVVLTIFLYLVFMVGPFVFILYGTHQLLSLNMGWLITVVICVFVLLLLIQLLVMIANLARDKNKKFLLTMPKCDYVRLNWLNIHVLLFELLEFLQTLALVFKFAHIPMFGGSVLHIVSTYLLFSFFSYTAVFWTTAVVFVVWFFLCGAPHIFEKILKIIPEGGVGSRSSWRLALSLLSNTLFVTIIESLSASLACTYQSCPQTNTNHTTTSTMNSSMNISNTTSCFEAMLIEDPSVQCWRGEHLGQATFALVAIVWYSTTSLIFGTEFGDPDNKQLDIGFSPIYNMIINVFKAGMVVVATLVSDEYAVLGLLLAGLLLCVFYTASFRCFFASEPCNLPSVLVWRLCTFISCIFAVVGVLVAFLLRDTTSIVPLSIFLAGTFVTFIVSLIATVKLSQVSSVERARDKFKVEIVDLHRIILANDWMHEGWKKQERTWLRLVRSVREAWKDDRDIGEAQDLNSIQPFEFTSLNMQPAQAEGWENQIEEVSLELETALPSPKARDSQSNDELESRNDVTLNMPCNEQKESTSSRENIEAINDTAPSPILLGDFQPPSYQSISNVRPPPNYTSSEPPSGGVDVQPTYLPPDSVLELEKNGRNLLLILEQNIHYSAYRYSCLSQRNIWINMVCESDWTKLLRQVEILKENLQGTYHKPSQLDIQLANTTYPEFELVEDEQDSDPPPPLYVRRTKEEIREESSEMRAEVVEFFGQHSEHGNEYRQLVDKLLPTTAVYKSVTLTGQSFTIVFRKGSCGVVKEYEPPGLKVALGAQLCVGKQISGIFSSSGISFTRGCAPVGKKGPVSVAAESIGFVKKNDHLYLETNGKKLKFEVVLCSFKTVIWT